MTSGHIAYLTPDATWHERLVPVARRIFTETFAHRFPPDAFARFCEETYGLDGSMRRDSIAHGVHWRIAAIGDQPIGYAKLTPLRAPAIGASASAVELQQIYVLSSWHGKGIADELMRWGIEAARNLGAAEVYLTVFDDNERAKRFYTRYGFEDVGRCAFTLGRREYDDRIWRLKLS